jgi:hypothetical protein
VTDRKHRLGTIDVGHTGRGEPPTSRIDLRAGKTMSAVKPGSAIDLTSIPRAVLSVAAGVVHSVERAMVGDARIRTARGNAWEAICADRDRALRRDEIRALVASLAPTPVPTAGLRRPTTNPRQPVG